MGNEKMSLEKVITTCIIQEDIETIYYLLCKQKDGIFNMCIIPYYALFVNSFREYSGITFNSDMEVKIETIRNHIKIYSDRFGKSMRHLRKIDDIQNESFKSQLKFDILKEWNVHYNLGTYWTENHHIIGNTQMIADFLDIDDIFNSNIPMNLFNLGKLIGEIVSYARKEFMFLTKAPEIIQVNNFVPINFYLDINTDRNSNFFRNTDKELNLFYLNLLCNLNYVKYILRPLFNNKNSWIFRIEYITTYYTFRALSILKGHCKNNKDIEINMQYLEDVLKLNFEMFKTPFRNCMMHYGFKENGVLSSDYINKPLYGMIESFYDGMDYYDYLNELHNVSDRFIAYLEDNFIIQNINLESF